MIGRLNMSCPKCGKSGVHTCLVKRPDTKEELIQKNAELMAQAGLDKAELERRK